MVTKKTEAKHFFANFSDIADSISRNIDAKTEELKNFKIFDDLTEELKLGIIKIKENPNNFNESWEKWEKYLDDNDSSRFNESNILDLCFSYESLNDSRFWNLINTDKFITDSVISYLVRNLHYFWTDLDDFDTKRDIFKSMLGRIDSNREIIKYWKEKPHVIIGDKNRNFVQFLTNLLISKKITINALYKNKKYDIRNCDILSNLVECEVLKEEIKNINFENITKIYESFKDFIKYSEKSKTNDSRRTTKSINIAKNNIIAEIIFVVDRLNKENSSRGNSFKEDLTNFLVDKLGDPRIINWDNFEEGNKLKAKNIIDCWLNERDIKFFFENLIDADPQYRKDFWIGYAPKIQESLFLLGNNVSANRKNYNEIDNFRNLMPKKFLKIGDSDHNFSTNVFILKIGRLYILEFSEEGNACYFYDEKTYKEHIAPKFNTQHRRQVLKTSELKQQQLCLDKMSHRATWQPKFKEFIDKYS